VAQQVTDSTEIATPAKIPFWHDPTKRAIIYQVVVLSLVGMLGYYLFTNTQANLERQAIATGFGFFAKEASFEIGESPIPYSAADTYARALLVGVLNTLKVAFIGIILTVILGTIFGIARLSTNWLVAKLAGVYIEVMQDIPVLLQLFFWYSISYEILPSPRQALNPFTGNLSGWLCGSLGPQPLGQETTGRNRATFSCLSRLYSHSPRLASSGLAVRWCAPEDGCPRAQRLQFSRRPHPQP
jgi:general L-amino acid transport system permease protein